MNDPILDVTEAVTLEELEYFLNSCTEHKIDRVCAWVSFDERDNIKSVKLEPWE